MGSDHNHLHEQVAVMNLSNELETIHARHLQVGDDDLEFILGKQPQRFAGARSTHDFVAGLAQDVSDRFTRRRVIVDNQHALNLCGLSCHYAAILCVWT